MFITFQVSLDIELLHSIICKYATDRHPLASVNLSNISNYIGCMFTVDAFDLDDLYDICVFYLLIINARIDM